VGSGLGLAVLVGAALGAALGSGLGLAVSAAVGTVVMSVRCRAAPWVGPLFGKHVVVAVGAWVGGTPGSK